MRIGTYMSTPVSAGEPFDGPRKFRLTKETERIAATIGIVFEGRHRHNDVYAYDIDEGWIENKKGLKEFGKVEPFWRTATVFPTPSLQTEEAAQLAQSAAEEKRRRKAAKLMEKGL